MRRPTQLLIIPWRSSIEKLLERCIQYCAHVIVGLPWRWPRLQYLQDRWSYNVFPLGLPSKSVLAYLIPGLRGTSTLQFVFLF
jgi:hypothetical protein